MCYGVLSTGGKIRSVASIGSRTPNWPGPVEHPASYLLAERLYAPRRHLRPELYDFTLTLEDNGNAGRRSGLSGMNTEAKPGAPTDCRFAIMRMIVPKSWR
jgi:hypothetical protein